MPAESSALYLGDLHSGPLLSFSLTLIIQAVNGIYAEEFSFHTHFEHANDEFFLLVFIIMILGMKDFPIAFVTLIHLPSFPWYVFFDLILISNDGLFRYLNTFLFLFLFH